MAQGFRRRRGRIVAALDDDEREILASLFAQTARLLRSAAAEPNAPEDEFERMMRSAGLGDEPVGGAGGDDDPLPLSAPTSGIDEEALSADPALGRLLPDGHHDDPLAAAEFRASSIDGIRRAKIAHLERAILAVQPDGRPLRLDEEDAVAVMVSLTDVRLVLAERLGLRTEEDAAGMESRIRGGEAAADAPLILTYDFLTWLQETLAQALSG